jgi:hypothetical protein
MGMLQKGYIASFTRLAVWTLTHFELNATRVLDMGCHVRSIFFAHNIGPETQPSVCETPRLRPDEQA